MTPEQMAAIEREALLTRAQKQVDGSLSIVVEILRDDLKALIALARQSSQAERSGVMDHVPDARNMIAAHGSPATRTVEEVFGFSAAFWMNVETSPPATIPEDERLMEALAQAAMELDEAANIIEGCGLASTSTVFRRGAEAARKALTVARVIIRDGKAESEIAPALGELDG